MVKSPFSCCLDELSFRLEFHIISIAFGSLISEHKQLSHKDGKVEKQQSNLQNQISVQPGADKLCGLMQYSTSKCTLYYCSLVGSGLEMVCCFCILVIYLTYMKIHLTHILHLMCHTSIDTFGFIKGHWF